MRLPPEDRLRLGRERAREEAELDEGAGAGLQDRVEHLVDVGERVHRHREALGRSEPAAVLVAVHEHVVVEQTVEPDVASTEHGDRLAEVRLPVGPERLVRPAGADAHTPDVSQGRVGHGGTIDHDRCLGALSPHAGHFLVAGAPRRDSRTRLRERTISPPQKVPRDAPRDRSEEARRTWTPRWRSCSPSPRWGGRRGHAGVIRSARPAPLPLRAAAGTVTRRAAPGARSRHRSTAPPPGPARRRRSRGRCAEAPTPTTTPAPAARAAAIPCSESSKTRQRSIGTPRATAAAR